MSLSRLLGFLENMFGGFTCTYCGKSKSKGNYYLINQMKFCKKTCLRKYSKENNIKCDYCKDILTDDVFLEDRENDNLNFCSDYCCVTYYQNPL